MAPKEPRIKILQNGPYIVSGQVPLAEQVIKVNDEEESEGWAEGKKYPLRDSYSLCRCGQSGKRPFCDGTHARVGFVGTEVASRAPFLEQAEVTDGPTLKLTDNVRLCAVARFCERDEGVWDLTEQSDDPEARKMALEEAADCPSGRLVVWDKRTEKAIEPVFERSIGLVMDPQAGVSGPIWVRGGILIESANGTVYEVRNRVTLCRCGRSSNKPFCDTAHMH
jgi:CDGSH-type Zn-finger protein